ncbi:uncharacterized protein LOC109707525 [Ananas comosus]|uniref:Uncharacterized protein LOC109707525 n=1 Tax=Ananas comosus TaxID=4615 RepID=A0A6P5ELT6_ANACO|nr:uncharacterized protein LOC109707525 [Ananas comosus]
MHQTPYTGRPTPSSATAPRAIPEIRSYQVEILLRSSIGRFSYSPHIEKKRKVMVQPLAVDSKMLGSSLFCAQNDLAAGLAWPESGSAMGTSGQPRSVSTSNWCYNTQPLTATQFGDQDLGSRYSTHQFDDLASLLDNNTRASTVGESFAHKSYLPSPCLVGD